jgi:hypothetical protein
MALLPSLARFCADRIAIQTRIKKRKKRGCPRRPLGLRERLSGRRIHAAHPHICRAEGPWIVDPGVAPAKLTLPLEATALP